MRSTKLKFAIAALLMFAVRASAADAKYLYKSSLLQAAPGKLLALIDLYKSAAEKSRTAGDEPPFWMRHSQGDHWDLLILQPVAAYPTYFNAERSSRRENVSTRARDLGLIAWQEDTFVYGPPLDTVKSAFKNAGFFHVEMFISLPGKDADLYKEREMENTYLRMLKEPENLIFVRDQGGAWDLFTIGFYRDLKQYAEGSSVPASQQDASAKAAGFEDASHIGPYLRTLISSHHDTLAVAVKP